MNMKIRVDKRLAELCFLVLILLCGSVEALKDRKFIHQEIVENQQRVMNKNSLIITKEVIDTEKIQIPIVTEKGNEGDDSALNGLNQKAGDSDADIKGEETEDKEEEEKEKKEEKKNSTEKKLTFWSGFVDSLSMIFFVEFGDRVHFLYYP
jgi:hypothetical protein